MPLKEFKAHLVPEIKELSLFIKKNLLSATLSGEISSSFKGKGIEFEDFRDYTPEDDAARIDWRSSKKAQRLLVREYRLEVNFSVFFLIDVSESMLFASTNKLKCEYAAEMICSLYYGILQTGTSVGFGLFSEKLKKIIKPQIGKKQFYLFTSEISNPKNYGGAKNIGLSIQQALSLLDRKAVVILVSDFIGFDAAWSRFLKIMARRHEVISILIRDPRDLSIPKNIGQLVLGDPFSDEKLYIDSRQYYQIYEQYTQKELQMLRILFQHNRITLLELITDTPYLDKLLQFLKRRGARWR